MTPPRTAVLERASARRREPSSGVVAVLSVLEALDRRPPTTLAELSRRTGIAKSTLHRVCGVMAGAGWVSRERASGAYSLGSRAVALGLAQPESPLVAAFQRRAARLLAAHNETTCLMVLEHDQTVFVAKAETTHPVRLVTELGSRLPAFASASGRVLLADRAATEVEALYRGRALVTPTGRELGGLPALQEILRRARREGFAENVDETALGLHCIAAPVGGRGGVVAAMTLCVPSGRMTPERRRRMLPDLLSAANDLLPHDDPSHDGQAPQPIARGRTP
jgi:IclR family transcriptional regulator, pca regulon regulatory protein